MPRFMIELPFAEDTCLQSLQKFGQKEADFLPQVYWGCSLSGQEGWAIVEAEDADQARQMVPESLRDKVWVSEVKTLTPELIEAIQAQEIEKAA